MTQLDALSLNEISSIALQVRNEFIDIEGDISGLCLDISTKIQGRLKALGMHSDIIEGGFYLDFPMELDDGTECYDSLHYWIEVDGFIIDATATQFLDYMEHGTHIDDVLVLNKNESPSHFT